MIENTFTKEELELIYAALTHYWNFNHQEHERKKAKGRKNCNWHVTVMNKITNLESKIFYLKNSM